METHDHFYHAYSPMDAFSRIVDIAEPGTRGLVFVNHRWQEWIVSEIFDRCLGKEYAKARHYLKLSNDAEIVFISQLDSIGGLLVDYVVAEFDMARDPDTMTKLSIRTLRGKS